MFLIKCIHVTGSIFKWNKYLLKIGIHFPNVTLVYTHPQFYADNRYLLYDVYLFFKDLFEEFLEIHVSR